MNLAFHPRLPRPWPARYSSAVAAMLVAGLVCVVALADVGSKYTHAHCADGQVPKYDVVGVHYSTTIANATAHFQAAGFVDITDMKIGTDHLWCQPARRAAVDAWDQCKAGEWFYQGVNDALPNCQLYFFDTDGYTGHDGCPAGKGTGGYAGGEC